MGRNICALVFFIQLLISASAQQIQPKVKWLTNDARLELKDDIADVRIDKEGNLWIVTFSEIVRYDSQSYYPINTETVKHSSLLKFKETPKGEKFVYDKNGEVFFIEGDTLRAYRNNDILFPKNQTDGNLGYKIFDIGFDSLGTVFFFSKNRDLKINGSQVEVAFQPKVQHLDTGYMELQVDSGLIRLAFKFDTLFTLIGKEKLEFYAKMSHLNRKHWNQTLLIVDENDSILNIANLSKAKYILYPAIVPLSEHQYLFSSGFGHLLKIDQQGGVKKIAFDWPIHHLFQDSKKNIWISTLGHGIHVIPKGDFEHGKRRVVMDGLTAIISAEDHEGGIWGYQEKKGVFRIEYPFLQISSQTGKLGKSGYIIDLEIYDGKLLISTPNQLQQGKLNISNFKNISLPSRDNINKDNSIYSLSAHPNNLELLATQRGKMWSYSDQKWIRKKESLDLIIGGNKIKFAKQFKRLQNVVIGNLNSQYFILNLDNDSIIFSDPFPYKIEALLLVGDSVYLRGKSNLDLSLMNQKENIDLDERFPELSTSITDFYYFDERVFVATKTKGVYAISGNKIEAFDYKGEKIIDARFHEQNDSSLWLFAKNGSFNYIKQEKKNGFYLCGYSPIVPTSITAECGDNSTFFLGTINEGLLYGKYETIKEFSRTPPILNIQSIALGDSSGFDITSTVSTSYQNNELKVSYNAVSYDEKELIYQYQLIGQTDDWVSTSSNNLQISNLNPGEYTFNIRARKKNQPWSNVKSFPFIIRPPFWYTWWFISLASIGLFSITFFIIQYRISVLQREKSLQVDRLKAEQKALRSQMSPHFIFNILSSIRYLVNNKSKDKVNQFLDMFSNSMRNILDQSNEDQITMKNELKLIREYIEMERFRLEEHFDYQIEDAVEPDFLNHLIPPFIIQPIIENAIQYGLKSRAKGGLLKVGISNTLSYFVITVEDNGVGRKKAGRYQKKVATSKRQSHGIRIIKERLSLHNGKENNLFIRDLHDEENKVLGTQVTLYIKIIKDLNT